jgi:hypothetical protein
MLFAEDTVTENVRKMKQFILLLLISGIYITGLANPPVYSSFGNDTLAKEEQQVSSKLKIYPNPCSTGQVTLEMDDHLIAEIRVINITGKEILQRKIDFGVNKYQLKLYDIPKGIYFLRVRTTENKVVAKKLVVSEM